jgi:LacI family transcriptional regulator
MKPLDWGRYSELLCRLQQGPALSGPVKRIALVGLPLLDRGPHPIKAALAESLDKYPNWQITFMSDAYLESFELLTRIPCDGVLARVVSEEMAAMARKVSCPLVNISSLVGNPGVQTVRRDDRQLGHLCARHLLEKGFSRIGVIELVPVPGWCFGETLAGFMEFVQSHASGVAIDRLQIDLTLTEPEMMALLRGWLRGLRTPCALFLTDDRFSIAVMDASREEGLSIPKDVAVISSVLTPEMADACGVSLTHPVQDGDWLVGPACERLESLMSNPRQPLQTIIIPCPGVVQGDSTETFAIDDPLVARAVDFIACNFQSGINVADIVSHLDCSRRVLERRFVSLMNVTLHDYLVSKRVGLAKECMRGSPELKLDQIARRCGFGDRRSFRLAFLRLTGITPDKWRGHPETAGE